MQEAQIVSRNLDESVAIPGSSSEQKSNRDLPRIDILKELNEENELKSTPRLRLLEEDDFISDKLAASPGKLSFWGKYLILSLSPNSPLENPLTFTYGQTIECKRIPNI